MLIQWGYGANVGNHQEVSLSVSYNTYYSIYISGVGQASPPYCGVAQKINLSSFYVGIPNEFPGGWYYIAIGY